MSKRSTCSSASSQPLSSVPSHPARARAADTKNSLLSEISPGQTEVVCRCCRTKHDEASLYRPWPVAVTPTATSVRRQNESNQYESAAQSSRLPGA